jgi:glucose 1-dehydrogenase
MRVLVTGASRGIGRATALRLALAGNDVAVGASAHANELDSLVAAVGNAGKLLPVLGDLTDATVPGRLVDQAVDAFGGLDAVVSNAGVSRPTPLATTTLDDWDYLFDVNVRAGWLLAKSAYPHLRQSRGTYVAISSMSGVQPYPGMGAYSPTKAALIMLVRVLAQEWAADGIRVNCVSPGLIRTPMTEPLYSNPDIKAVREQLIPMGRIGNADNDIAGVVAFLLSPDAGFVTGQNILADGGLMDAIHAQIRGRPATQRT